MAWRDAYTVPLSLLGCFDQKAVAMLAEIFMMRLDIQAKRS